MAPNLEVPSDPPHPDLRAERGWIDGFMHALDVGTMSAWISLIGACVVGLVVRDHSLKDAVAPLPSTVIPEGTDITLSDRLGTPQESADQEETPGAVSEETPSPETPELTHEAPPEMPLAHEIEPLPSVPDLPAPQPAARQEQLSPGPAPARPAKPSTAARTSSSNPGQGRQTAAASSGTGKPGISASQRLSGGSMPKPRYPAVARSRGQTGTVVVEFVVGENGRVVSVRAKNPSPWPLLNNAALDAVRAWRFPPGGVTTYTRPIVFNLN